MPPERPLEAAEQLSSADDQGPYRQSLTCARLLESVERKPAGVANLTIAGARLYTAVGHLVEYVLLLSPVYRDDVCVNVLG